MEADERTPPPHEICEVAQGPMRGHLAPTPPVTDGEPVTATTIDTTEEE